MANDANTIMEEEGKNFMIIVARIIKANSVLKYAKKVFSLAK